METARQGLEKALNAITRMADVAVGRNPVVPAEKAAFNGTGEKGSP
jgi:hypothetical protein